MAHSLYLGKLSSEERNSLVGKLMEAQSNNCFICGDPINLQLNAPDIDHVEPIVQGGKDGPENFAITHESCNRSKQDSNLQVARVLAAFSKMADAVKSENRSPNLHDVLLKHGGAKHELSVLVAGETIEYALPEVGTNASATLPVYTDTLSGFRYCFMYLPIEYLHHDSYVNPRAIGSNLGKLVKEFHKRLPQLHITLASINTTKGNKVKLQAFDGQHKAAAQILLGVRALPVRVFIDPDEDALLTANTNAGTVLRQVAFDKSVQRSLGSALLKDRISRFQIDRGMDPDEESFSESQLVAHFRGESAAMKRYVIDRIRNGITHNPDNKLSDYIDLGGRGNELPLSYSTIEKTFYSFFISGELLDSPFNFKVEEGENPRDLEISQVVRLMNLIADEVYIGMFDPGRGTRRIESDLVNGNGDDISDAHLRAFRMSKEEIIYNWLKFVHQIVFSHFSFLGKPVDQNRLFQYPIPEQCWTNLLNYVRSLSALPVWVNRDLANAVFGGKQNYQYWQSIFTTGQTPYGMTVMPVGLNLNQMILPHD